MKSGVIKINLTFYILTAIGFIALYFIQLENYLLFHVFAELFSIVIAFSVYIIAWNGRKYMKNSYLLLFGIAYLFIGFIDLLHTLGYMGMSIFTDYDYYANQFWIAGRIIESVTLFIGSIFVTKNFEISTKKTLIIYTIITTAFIYSILFSDIFPPCFIEGEGQTQFKIISEYVVILILLLVIFNFYRNRKIFEKEIYTNILLSVIFTIISEIAFIFYISNYGISNMIGHYSKIISFYFIYRAVIKKNILDPYDSIFKELKTSNELKTRLFSIISHDLSSPMAAINSIAQTIDDEFDNYNDNEKHLYISELRKAIDNNAVLLENLLDWSKLEIGGHQMRKLVYDPQKLVDEVISGLQTSYKRKNIRIEKNYSYDGRIKVDENTFRIIIHNILTNALKFSDKDNKVEVYIESDEKNIMITINDHGVGMVFNHQILNQPVNNTSRGTEGEKGTGLGLYMINKYTEENDGIMHVSSILGEGTKFTIKFLRV